MRQGFPQHGTARTCQDKRRAVDEVANPYRKELALLLEDDWLGFLSFSVWNPSGNALVEDIRSRFETVGGGLLFRNPYNRLRRLPTYFLK